MVRAQGRPSEDSDMTSMTYRLPLTQLVVSGVLRTSKDQLTVVGGKPTTTTSLVSTDVKLVTSAELGRDLTLTPPKGRFTTYKGSFGLTADGRLKSASADVTGEVGAAIKSVASLAGTILAIVALGPEEAPKDDADNDAILAAYRAAYEKEHDAFTTLRKQRNDVEGRVRDAITTSVDGAGDLAELRRLRSLLALIDERLVPAEAHFRAWRARKITHVDEAFELRVPLADIRGSVQEAWGSGGVGGLERPPESLEQLWTGYGVGIEGSWLRERTTEPQSVGTAADHVYTRVPDLLELRVMKPDGDRAIESSRQRATVADDRSKVVKYKLETSRLGRKSLALTFDADGFVSNVAVEGSSALAAGLSAATGAVEGFTAGVEGGTKAYKAVRAAGHATLDAELARVKSEIELREQRLLAAGLDATGADAVELKRLEQLQGILEAQTKIRESDPGLVTQLAEQAGGDLEWYKPPAPAEPPEPQVIRILLGEDGQSQPKPPSPVPSPPPLSRPPEGTDQSG
jgi:hypothetical protein